MTRGLGPANIKIQTFHEAKEPEIPGNGEGKDTRELEEMADARGSAGTRGATRIR